MCYLVSPYVKIIPDVILCNRSFLITMQKTTNFIVINYIVKFINTNQSTMMHYILLNLEVTTAVGMQKTHPKKENKSELTVRNSISDIW